MLHLDRDTLPGATILSGFTALDQHNPAQRLVYEKIMADSTAHDRWSYARARVTLANWDHEEHRWKHFLDTGILLGSRQEYDQESGAVRYTLDPNKDEKEKLSGICFAALVKTQKRANLMVREVGFTPIEGLIDVPNWNHGGSTLITLFVRRSKE